MAAPDTGQENATTIKLTQEDVEKIKSLPKRTFLIGNLQQTGLYDEKNQTLLLLRRQWRMEWTPCNHQHASLHPRLLTRKNLKMRVPARRSQWMTAATAAMLQLPSLIRRRGFFSFLKKKGDGAESPIMEKPTPPYQKRVPLTWMHVVVIGIILLLLMVFVITPAVNRVFAPPDVPPASSTEVTPPSGSQQGTEGENPQTSEPDPTLSNIQVIQVKDIMIPGDTITEDNVQAAEISAADYELLRANGRILYQWETVNNLIGMVVNKYIPKGGYIASGDESATYTPASNPWVNEQAGMTYVTLPSMRQQPPLPCSILGLRPISM